MRYTAHREVVGEVTKTVCVHENETHTAHQLRLLEVIRKGGDEFRDEEGIIVRKRGDEPWIDGEVVLGGMAGSAGSPVFVKGLVEKQIGPLKDQSIEGWKNRVKASVILSKNASESEFKQGLFRGSLWDLQTPQACPRVEALEEAGRAAEHTRRIGAPPDAGDDHLIHLKLVERRSEVQPECRLVAIRLECANPDHIVTRLGHGATPRPLNVVDQPHVQNGRILEVLHLDRQRALDEVQPCCPLCARVVLRVRRRPPQRDDDIVIPAVLLMSLHDQVSSTTRTPGPAFLIFVPDMGSTNLPAMNDQNLSALQPLVNDFIFPLKTASKS